MLHNSVGRKQKIRVGLAIVSRIVSSGRGKKMTVCESTEYGNFEIGLGRFLSKVNPASVLVFQSVI